MTTAMSSPARGAASSPAQRLQTTTAAVRVSFTWFGVRKTLTPTQKSQAAETFGAEGQSLSAAKKLLDTRCPAFRAVTTVKNRIVAFWKSLSLPYPDPGIRLIRQDRLQRFNDVMTELRQELAESAAELDRQLPQLRKDAQDRLGQLYDPADYPPTLDGLFAVEWDFPSVEPPGYLMQLNPELYRQEERRLQARFEEAVQMAEHAFIGELTKLVAHLHERLTGAEDGVNKTFRDTAVQNLHEFFARFRDMNVRSNQDLDDLVGQAQKLLRGVGPQDLRDSQALRQQIATQLAGVQASLDSLIVDQPRRRILRPGRETGT